MNSIFIVIKSQESITKQHAELIEKREKFRKEKKFKEADEIRRILKKKGIILEDTPKGVKWRKI